MPQDEISVQAQGIFDAFRLFDKELIDKILRISKTIHVQTLENGVTRIMIDLVPNNVKVKAQ